MRRHGHSVRHVHNLDHYAIDTLWVSRAEVREHIEQLAPVYRANRARVQAWIDHAARVRKRVWLIRRLKRCAGLPHSLYVDILEDGAVVVKRREHPRFWPNPTLAMYHMDERDVVGVLASKSWGGLEAALLEMFAGCGVFAVRRRKEAVAV